MGCGQTQQSEGGKRAGGDTDRRREACARVGSPHGARTHTFDGLGRATGPSVVGRFRRDEHRGERRASPMGLRGDSVMGCLRPSMTRLGRSGRVVVGYRRSVEMPGLWPTAREAHCVEARRAQARRAPALRIEQRSAKWPDRGANHLPAHVVTCAGECALGVQEARPARSVPRSSSVRP